MIVTEKLSEKSTTPYVSFEILPPLKGKSIRNLYDILDPLMEFKPPFIYVTYHCAEYIYKDNGNGLLTKIAIRKRPGTVGICSAIMYKYKTEAVPHFICGGFTKDETENALVDLHYLGIKNVLALRGDAPGNQKSFEPETNGHAHAIELVEQINKMNNGVFLEEEVIDDFSTDFCVGVAGYPEKHIEAPSKKNDIKHLKAKIDAGASYIITQMFFDNKSYFNFVTECRESGINVPIIPGIKPITSKKQIEKIPSAFHVSFPDDLIELIERCDSNEKVKKAGEEWAINQCKELVKAGVPALHFFTMGKPEASLKILRKVL